MNKDRELKDYISNNNLDLDRVVDDYIPYIRTVINNMVHNNLSEEDKEEIVLDTFFILWRKYVDNYHIELLSSYLAGIARNLVREKLKKTEDTVDILEYENSIENSDIYMYSIEREEILLLKNSLKNLKSKDMVIIEMFYYSSKSIKDIAKELKMSEANVKTRLHRIRKKVKKELSKGGF